MSDNKLVSGGLVFALTSLVTYSYHHITSNNRRSKYNYDKYPMLSIQEDVIGEEEVQNKITPSNSPRSEKSIEYDNELPNYDTNDSPLTVEEHINEEQIQKLVDIVDNIEKQIEKKTESQTFSSFLESS